MSIVTDGTRKFEVIYSPPAGSGGSLLWTWIQVMLAAGWTGIQTGDGTTKTAGAVALEATCSNTNFWQQLRAPTGTLELTIQKDATDYGVRAYLSMAGFGSGGSGSAPPSPPSDALQIVGTGNAFDTGGFIWSSGTANDYRWSICADSVAHRGFYYFHVIGRQKTAGTGQRRLVFDTVESDADGTVGDADAAPWVMLHGSTVSFPTLGSGASWSAWYKKGLSGEALDVQQLIGYPAGGFGAGTLGQNPYTGTHERAKIPIHRLAGNVQNKGKTHTLRMVSNAPGSHDTFDLATEGEARIHYESNIVVPWPSGVAVVV